MKRRSAGQLVAMACAFALILAGGRTAIANHGNVLVETTGAIGTAKWQPVTCDTRSLQLDLPAPDYVGASYSATDAPSQRVWWTPRVWWQTLDDQGRPASPILDHSEWAQYGWFYTWAHPGDNYGGGMIYYPFPEVGSTGGGAYPAWSDINGQTMPASFTIPITVATQNSKVFAVEYIFYWEPTDLQPLDGWWSSVSPVWTDLLTTELSCVFP